MAVYFYRTLQIVSHWHFCLCLWFDDRKHSTFRIDSLPPRLLMHSCLQVCRSVSHTDGPGLGQLLCCLIVLFWRHRKCFSFLDIRVKIISTEIVLLKYHFGRVTV